MASAAPPLLPQPKIRDLEEILLFTHVVRLGSFSAAARVLGLPKSTASRKLAALEERVGARLLQRTTRSVALTDVGRVYHAHCVRIVAEIEEAELAVAQLSSAPRGELRVTMPLTFGFVGPLIAEYLGRFPDVRLELVCTDRQVDLVEERFDLALRAGVTADSSSIARKLGVVRRRLVAAPAIAKRLRKVASVEELCAHPCVAFAPEGSSWQLQAGARTHQIALSPRLVANDYEVLRSVTRSGFGIALLPEYLVVDDVRAGTLVHVLPAWSGPAVPILALYPTARHLSPKLSALLDLLQGRLAAALSIAGTDGNPEG